MQICFPASFYAILTDAVPRHAAADRAQHLIRDRTGGLGGIVIPHCRREVIYEKNLLVNGLWELYQKNKRKR